MKERNIDTKKKTIFKEWQNDIDLNTETCMISATINWTYNRWAFHIPCEQTTYCNDTYIYDLQRFVILLDHVIIQVVLQCYHHGLVFGVFRVFLAKQMLLCVDMDNHSDSSCAKSSFSYTCNRCTHTQNSDLKHISVWKKTKHTCRIIFLYLSIRFIYI